MADHTPRAFLDAAQARYDSGDAEAAIAALRDGITQFAGRPGILMSIANRLAAFGAPRPALDCLAQLLADEPGHWNGLSRRTALACQVRDFDQAGQALRALDQAAETPGQKAAAALARAQFLTMSGYPEQAAEENQRAFSLDPGNQTARLREIDRLMEAGAPGPARELLEGFLDTWPDVPAGHIRRVQLAQAAAGPASAIAAARELTARFPQFEPGYLEWAHLLELDGQTDAARDALRETAGRFPASARALLKLSALDLRCDNPDAALAWARQARRRAPQAPEPALAEVRCLDAAAQPEEARALLEPYVARDHAHPGVFTYLIRLADRMNDLEAMESYARQGLRRFPDNPELLALLARRSLAGTAPVPIEALAGQLAGKWPTARIESLCSDLLMKNYDFPAALTRLRQAAPRRNAMHACEIGRALTFLNRTALAIRYLRFCLRRWPDNQTIAAVAMSAFNRAGRDAEGAAFFTELAAAHGADGIFFDVQLAHLCFRAGKMQKGLHHYQAALAQGRLNYTQISLFIRCLAADGDVENARRLTADFQRLGKERNKQLLKTYQGQIVTEIALELAYEDSAVLRRLPAGDMTGFAKLVQEFPRSNVAGMRLVRNWCLERPQTTGAPAPIPRTVYQYWNDPTPPEAVCEMMASWRAAPGFEHRLYDRQKALLRLRKDFGPRWLRAFLLANNPAEEADFLRLCLLAREGGIYADADDSLIGSPERLTGGDTGLVVYVEAFGWNLGNNFLAARAGHPAIVLAARMARQALLMRSNETTWSKTGPGLLTRAVAQYLARQITEGQAVDATVLRMADTAATIAMHNPVHYKRKAGDWRQMSKTEAPDILAGILHETLKGAA